MCSIIDSGKYVIYSLRSIFTDSILPHVLLLFYPFSLFAVSATHKETKQFFTLYNTLDDKKVYLEKEVRKCYYCFLSIQSVGKEVKSFCLAFTIFSPVRAELLVFVTKNGTTNS